MNSLSQGDVSLKWRLPFAVGFLATATSFALVLYSSNFGEMAGIFLVTPLAGLILLVLLIRRKRMARYVCLAILCFYVLLSWQMLKHSAEIRSESRWLSSSRTWKAEVLKQPSRTTSGVRYVVWDGWGMFAQDTDVYLVFSPDDGLRKYSPSNLSGLPCPVWRVQRLEKQWYSVTFYTNEGWDGCGSAG
jgi:hypothetical protein